VKIILISILVIIVSVGCRGSRPVLAISNLPPARTYRIGSSTTYAEFDEKVFLSLKQEDVAAVERCLREIAAQANVFTQPNWPSFSAKQPRYDLIDTRAQEIDLKALTK
jgi:hypothetical protein